MQGGTAAVERVFRGYGRLIASLVRRDMLGRAGELLGAKPDPRSAKGQP
jgi:hypothetical protein